MPGKQKTPSYTSLVVQVLRDSAEPLPVNEILSRVEAERTIDTTSPKSTIRSALGQCRLIANTGDGRYAWYPRLIIGSFVRVILSKPDLDCTEPRIILEHDARELLWPSFFSHQLSMRNLEPVLIMLPDGTTIKMPLDFFGNSIWGTTGEPAFWAWLKKLDASTDDALVVEAMDADARRYRVGLESQVSRDKEALRQRTEEVEQAARRHLWNRRPHRVAIWDMAKYLLASGHYKNPVPPDPISIMWDRITNQFPSGEEINTARPRRPKKAEAVYRLKITLRDSRPPIWRRVLVTGDTTLDELHWIIQDAMGWTNSHLHQFIIGTQYYSDPDFELHEYTDEVRDEHCVKLSQAIKREKTRFIYEYDFGDGWRHDVLAEKILKPESGEKYPRCIAGQRACPPEDCGGVWGYRSFLETISNPEHPEHEEMLEWCGGSFDPEHIDIEQINNRLASLGAFKS